MLSSPLDVSEELREYPDAAVSLAECGLALWPHQTEIVSIATASHRELAEAIDACRGFVVVPTSPGCGGGALSCLARVTVRSVRENRVVLVIRGLCRAEVSNRLGEPQWHDHL